MSKKSSDKWNGYYFYRNFSGLILPVRSQEITLAACQERKRANFPLAAAETHWSGDKNTVRHWWHNIFRNSGSTGQASYQSDVTKLTWICRTVFKIDIPTPESSINCTWTYRKLYSEGITRRTAAIYQSRSGSVNKQRIEVGFTTPRIKLIRYVRYSACHWAAKKQTDILKKWPEHRTWQSESDGKKRVNPGRQPV